KVFGDGGTADVDASGDLVDGLAAVAQAVQNGAAGGVGDGVKDSAVLRNHFVTCFLNRQSNSQSVTGWLRVYGQKIRCVKRKFSPVQVIIVGNEIISDRLIAGLYGHGAAGPLDGESGQRLVCQTALAGGQQLSAGHCDQPTGD